MKHSIHERTIALAGVFQAASLVKQIANKGMANSAVIESSIESLFRFDVLTADDVYGNVSGVAHGIRILQSHIGTMKSSRDIEITKYAISLIALEKKLSTNKNMLDKIQRDLQGVESQLAFFSLNDNTTFSKIGNIYKSTISTLGPKIVVSGEQAYLSNEINASKVRALLLAGIRAAVLWRQCGGTRWQILFGRKHYLQECENILRQLL